MSFGSAHRALKAEEILKEAGVKFRLMPAPKALEPYCDLVILVTGDNLSGARDVLERHGVTPKAIYSKEGDGYVEV